MSHKRWRQPPLTRRTLALTLVLALHALFALVLWYEMQLEPPKLAAMPIDSDEALVVRFLDHPSTSPNAPPPAPPTLVPLRRVVNPRVRPVRHKE